MDKALNQFAAAADQKGNKDFVTVTITKEEFLYLLSKFPSPKHFFSVLRKVLSRRGLSFHRSLGVVTWRGNNGDYCHQNFFLPKELLPKEGE